MQGYPVSLKLMRVVLLLLFGLAACGCSAKSPPEPIILGYIAQGDLNRAATDRAWQGVLLAVAEANSQPNQVAGRPVQVLQADVRGEKEVGPTGVRLIKVNDVRGLLGGTEPAEAASLAPIAQSYAIPLIVGGSFPERRADNYVFAIGLSPAFQSQILARFAIEELKATRAAVLVNQTTSRDQASKTLSRALSAEFLKEFRKRNGEVVRETTALAPGDWKTFVDQIKDSRPSIILLAGVPGDVEELRRTGLDKTIPILFAGPEVDAKAFANNTAAQGIYVATAFVPGDETAAVKEFSRRFTAKAGEPPDAAAALAYDAARLLFEGLRRSTTFEGAKIREALEGLKSFDGVTGPLSWDETGATVRPGFIAEVSKGQLKRIKRYDPDKKGG